NARRCKGLGQGRLRPGLKIRRATCNKCRAGSPDSPRRLLVDQQPIHADLIDRPVELLEIDRLHDVGIGAELVGLAEVALFPRRGQHHHRDRPGARVAFDLLQHFGAVDLGQFQIEQQDDRRGAHVRLAVRAGAEQIVERLGPVAQHPDRVGEIAFAQRADRQLDVVGIVLDQHDFDRIHGARPDRVKENVAPRPGAASTQISPPWRWTMRCAMARPTPLPSKSSARCRRWNTPNSFPAKAMSKPAPLSATTYTVRPSCSRLPISMRAPGALAVNLTALPISSANTRVASAGSASHGGSAPIAKAMSRPCAMPAPSSITRRTIAAGSIRLLCRGW